MNANGPLYGVHEVSDDLMSVVDPIRNTMTEIPVPVRDVDTPYASPQTQFVSFDLLGKSTGVEWQGERT